jgi:hypothetical protein
MNRKTIQVIASALVLVAVLIACDRLPLQSISPEDPLAMSPEEVVEGFYNWYLRYPGNPNQGAYRSSPFLTESLMDRTAETVAGFQMGGYDPFLCAQDSPDKIFVGPAEITGSSAQIRVTSSFQGHAFRIHLIQEAGEWKVDQVLCGSSE